MAQHQQNHHPDLTVPHKNAIPPRIQQLITVARSQKPEDLIKQVHEGALMQYHRTKREKQHELAPRVVEASRSGDKIAFKNAKKKVDNHASSVASRSRRTFLISSFESVVGDSLKEKTLLAEELLRQNAVASKRDVELRRVNLRIAKLAKENQALKSQISKSMLNTKLAVLPAREDTWNPAASMETIVNTSTDPSVLAPTESSIAHLGELHRTNMELGEIDGAATATGYLDISTQGAAEASQCVEDNLKIDVSTEWGTLLAVYPGVQAQMKADTPSDVIFPAV